ncbi:MAG: hypothetical protein LUG51_09860 [Tannerellaceae bacterium]|nr:hypothetical protein [Tannerellaceae bacterium]
MKRIRHFFLLWVSIYLTTNSFAAVDPAVIRSTVNELVKKDSRNRIQIEKAVYQVAGLWQATDGSDKDFQTFYLENYLSDAQEKEEVFLKISDYLEGIYGHFNEMSLRLQKNMILNTGPLLPVDERFGSFKPSTHLSDDFYRSKIAFVVALNFPELSLKEKEMLGTNRKAWAYARLGDIFTKRIPAEIQQKVAAAGSDADLYIDAYNIYMGSLINPKGKQLFPDDMILLSHWNLRDEIKANYNKGREGTERQRTVYEVMKRIISQQIPVEAINSGTYNWNPYNNVLYKEGKIVQGTPESTIRYQKMLNNFKAQQEIDKFTGNTYIDRNFNEKMEIAQEEVEALFHEFLSAPELKEVGRMVSRRVKRRLEAYDIWYDGFKARSNLDETKLSETTRKLYPDAEALEKDLPNILTKLGFPEDRAKYLAEKIAVDNARGSGHAWGAAMKGQKSRLRTRIPAQGMDYKGYNIAIHEFGHNVEQTISLYDVDYYMLNGVPNTAFTEALAFVFQKRDLDILGIKNEDPKKEEMDILDKIWSMYEICGVSMLDIAVWKWMYANPDATAEQLREATIRLSKEIWNQYYAPVFGVRDETVLAIYSHMIGYPLYLSAYAFGQIIEFQIEGYLEGKDFATEVDRIYKLGRLTPTQWMREATGDPLSVKPMLEALNKKVLKKK